MTSAINIPAAGPACPTRTRHRFVVRHAWNGVVTACPRPRTSLHGAFDDAVDQLFGRERHLDVDLRELRLAIGAQILVAEAADDLEVAIQPAIIRICLKICGDCGSAKNSPGCTRLGTR
jgi:hypothetical protein